MTQPLPLDTALTEFSENSEAWVLKGERPERSIWVPSRSPSVIWCRCGQAARVLPCQRPRRPAAQLQGVGLYRWLHAAESKRAYFRAWTGRLRQSRRKRQPPKLCSSESI